MQSRYICCHAGATVISDIVTHFQSNRGLTYGATYDIIHTSKRAGKPPEQHKQGGDSVTVLEVLALLNLLTAIIFGVINTTKK